MVHPTHEEMIKLVNENPHDWDILLIYADFLLEVLGEEDDAESIRVLVEGFKSGKFVPPDTHPYKGKDFAPAAWGRFLWWKETYHEAIMYWVWMLQNFRGGYPPTLPYKERKRKSGRESRESDNP